MTALFTLAVAAFIAAGHLYGVIRDLMRPTRLEDEVHVDLDAVAAESAELRRSRGYGDLQTAKAHLLSADGQVAALKRGLLKTMLGFGLRDREVQRMEAAGDVMLAEGALALAVARLELDIEPRVGVELDGPMTVLRRDMPAVWFVVRLMAPAPVRGMIEVVRGHGRLGQAQARLDQLLQAVQPELDARRPAEVKRGKLADRVPMAS